MEWGIDRFGRSLTDLLHIIQHLEACGVDLYLDQQSIDTTTPMGRLVFQVTGAFAEFERTMIRQRVKGLGILKGGTERGQRHLEGNPQDTSNSTSFRIGLVLIGRFHGSDYAP